MLTTEQGRAGGCTDAVRAGLRTHIARPIERLMASEKELKEALRAGPV